LINNSQKSKTREIGMKNLKYIIGKQFKA